MGAFEGAALGKSSNRLDSVLPDAVPLVAEVGAGSAPPGSGPAAVLPAGAAGARSCFPHGHFTTFPAALAGIFKTASQEGHLIFMFVAIDRSVQVLKLCNGRIVYNNWTKVWYVAPKRDDGGNETTGTKSFTE